MVCSCDGGAHGLEGCHLLLDLHLCTCMFTCTCLYCTCDLPIIFSIRTQFMIPICLSNKSAHHRCPTCISRLCAEIYDESDETERAMRQRDKSAVVSQRNDVSVYLNLFDPKMRGNRLSPQESQAVFAFLTNNIEVRKWTTPRM